MVNKNMGNINQLDNIDSRLFCFIDNKNNIFLPSMNNRCLGNLSANGEDIILDDRMLLDDFTYCNQRIYNPSLALSTNKGNYILNYFKDKYQNCYFGYIDSNFIVTEYDINGDDYPNIPKIGEIITEKLYNNPIDINILSYVNDEGTISATNINIYNVVTLNNNNNNNI